jgi:hypothetical protein
MRVLIIPEDFRKDQYMLKPIIETMFKALGKPHAKIVVCKDPLLRGISQALDFDKITQIINRYGMVDLFLLCVDRDSNTTRRVKLDHLETKAQEILPDNKFFLAENAWQEIEVWVLAGHQLPSEWQWQQIRQERDPKEIYFLPLAQQRGVQDEPDQGRKTLTLEAIRHYSRIQQLCPEDIQNLEQRIKRVLT